ncbi:polyprenyl synthetase family protein [Campylobacter suis]|uniref:Octaprenyl diphosphate synthase n=1 Tax=Campylobacter suis TaxID=2790657 RepID=A0ABM8Q1E0_9BACT|nr:polyprenyl synthetase family protein [Campylobacter suis]CAD7286621.1 Octaprenyl diphosphate synthase [Campylobacter suis]
MQQIDEIMLKFINEFGYQSATQMFLRISSGKKLRSKLLLKIASPNQKAFTLCAIIELIHLASLLHDDVIDDANTRRGEPSINALFGTKNAIMLGDILYSKGFFELSKFEPKIAQVVSDAVSKLSIGELMDVELSVFFNTDKEKYMQMIYNKTAVLIEASAICGALLAGKDEQKFSIYGKNLGLAFQIIDDVLDITQDSKTLGKPALNDFVEGKMTLPYIYLYENLNDSDKDKLRSLYKKELDSTQISWLRQKFDSTGSIQKAVNLARELGVEALDCIKEYQDAELENIIISMIDREF